MPSPLDDGSLGKWTLVKFNISQLTLDAVKPFGLGNKEALRCKNMWTLGLALWMFDRDRAPIVDWLQDQVRQEARSWPRPISPRSTPAMPMAKRSRSAGRCASTMSTPRRPSRASIAPSPARNRSPRAGRGRATGRPADVLRRLSDHAGIGDPASPHRASRNMASPPSRRRTRSPRSARRSARAMPARWASPRRRVRASR